MVVTSAGVCRALPDPANGGQDGGAMDLLFLRGQVEIGFGSPVPIDEGLLRRLTDRGFRLTVMRDIQPLTADFLKQFNSVVWIGPTPISGGPYYNPAVWRGGVHALTVKTNRDLLLDYVNNGGGLFIDVVLEEMGMSRIQSYKQLLAPFGLNAECAQVRDETNKYLMGKQLSTFAMNYGWTEAIAKHPATEGVKRIYYADYMTRWDDNYTTVPIFPTDPAWVVLAKAAPGSYCGWKQGNVFEAGFWAKGPVAWNEAPLVLARDMGKGRVAAVGMSHFMLFYFGFSKVGNYWENSFGAQDGRMLEKGDGQTPSDLFKLMHNLFVWLSEPGTKLGLGGYEAKEKVEWSKATPEQQSDRLRVTLYAGQSTNLALGVRPPPEPVPPSVSEVWAGKDPICTGTVRPMKVLVGARTAASDGKGSVADYATAAKKAGYDVVCFTETFEATTEAKLTQLIEDCKKLSDDKVAFLAGVDIEDALGNRFLLVGLPERIRPHQLMRDAQSEPGKKLIWTGYMLLGMGDVLPVAARPGWLATPREKGCLPPPLYTHLAGVALATYRGGKQVDDGMDAYRWCMFNANIPAPIAVHEVYGPDELEAAAQAGLQCYVNSDTPLHAADYFRQGLEAYGGNPMRYYVSSGPLFDAIEMTPFMAPEMKWWQTRVKAHGSAPISEVLVRDQRRQIRRFTPAAKEVALKWNGDSGAHQWMYIELRDQAGGVAYSSGYRNLPRRNISRCMDRQNWYGLKMGQSFYPGNGVGPRPEVPGVKLAAGGLGLISYTYYADECVIFDCNYDYTDVPGAGPKGSIDSRPIYNAMPVPEYEAATRTIWRPYNPTVEETFTASIRLKQDLTATNAVWPVFARVAKKPAPKTPKPKPGEAVKPQPPKSSGIVYVYMDAKTGSRVQDEVPADGFVDLPANALAGDWLLHTPLRVSADGAIGLPSPGEGKVVKAGTVFAATFTKVIGDPVAAYKAMGCEGTSAFSFDLKQGQLDRIALSVYFKAEDYGVAGRLKSGHKPEDYNAKGRLKNDNAYDGMPRAYLDGANPRWPLGIWTSAGDGIARGWMFGTNITQYSYVDGRIASARMSIAKDFDFYYGNLLAASDTNLWLTFASDWTPDGATIEAHNPTDAPIEATVTSPKAIPYLKPIKQKVQVPPGSSVYVEVK
jgi:hypothetical protein